jgi:predicted acylesterase/phospholipase RssA
MLLVLLLAADALCACITLPRSSFTASEQAAASPAGFSHIRYAQDDPALADMLGAALRPGAGGVVNTLAISGGGANGAYAAGVLYGWSKTGQRPRFQLVTGVSAGALAAPFAFLGPGWDEPLKQSYTGPRVHHLLQARVLLRWLTPGFYRKGPLQDLVRTYVTDDLMRAVAAEQAKGRRLLVATTDLDTEQLVVWDMGAIAARPGPESRDLFAQVLIASASVPGIFSPTMIEVQADGRRFAEMHVDGQADSAFFAIPQTLLLGRRPEAPHFQHHLYVLVNGQVNSLFAVTPRATIPVLSRTIDAATKASVRSSLIATLQFCQRNGCDLNVSVLPSSVKDDPLDFSAAHIESLFSAGEAAALAGQAWTDAMPALSATPDAAQPQINAPR